MNRVTFGRMIHLSDKAIANLEEDQDANPTLATLTQVFAPFGGKITLAFPRMQPLPPGDEARTQRREAILTTLAKTRRRKKGS